MIRVPLTDDRALVRRLPALLDAEDGIEVAGEGTDWRLRGQIPLDSGDAGVLDTIYSGCDRLFAVLAPV